MRRCVALILILILIILLMLMIEQLSQSQVGRVTPVRAIVAAGRGLAALPVARHAAADARAFHRNALQLDRSYGARRSVSVSV